MITAAGIGSGLDIESLVTQLIAAERAPVENRLLQQDARITAELSAFGTFKGALSAFQSSLADLASPGNFGRRVGNSSDEDILEALSDGTAVNGSYDITVGQLAQAHSLASGAYASSDTEVGTGTLTLRFGTTDYTPPDPGPESYNGFTVNPERGVATITIDASNNTLEGVRDAINAADTGVNATIVNDGSGFRLLLSSEQTGAENSIEISVDDTGDGDSLDNAGLSALAFNSSANNLSQTVAAEDASFTVNGLQISSADNVVTDVIEGLDFTLKDVTGSAPVTVNVTEDTDALKEIITGFVDGFNGFVQTTNALTAFDTATGSAGALNGDFSVRSIVGQLRQVLVNAVEGFDGPFSNLSELGISTQSDGTLAIDDARMDAVLAQNYDDIVGIFAEVGLPSNSAIEYVTATEDTLVGSYAVEITQAATRGQLVGATAGFPLTIDADNDNFTIKIDGITSGSVSLTQGSYASGDLLAAELQARINGDSAIAQAGARVDVVYNGDHFEFTSREYGGSSTVELISVDTNSAAQLGLSVGAGVNGLNVAGTIDGVAALGSGKTLTATLGSDANGLQIRVNGSALGSYGEVAFSRGIAYQLDKLSTGFLDVEGILDTRTDTLQDRSEEIDEQRERLDRRMEGLEARYRAQFTALDTLLSQLQTTSDFLAQQLSNLPGAGSLNNNN
ncbi:MAG: hypothetical protein Hals2KO_33450 [Halioglobus sp.]